MSVESLVGPFVLAIAVNLVWRYFRRVDGQTIWFLGITSLSGSAVGVFAALLLGGSELADNPYWTYGGVPLIAAALTTRLQGLVVSWTAPNKHEE